MNNPPNNNQDCSHFHMGSKSYKTHIYTVNVHHNESAQVMVPSYEWEREQASETKNEESRLILRKHSHKDCFANGQFIERTFSK